MLQDHGTLKTWNTDRAFGFITPDAGGKDVFVHISDFGNIPRTPQAGDKVLFQETRDSTGRIKAGNVYIKGVKRVSVAPKNIKHRRTQPTYKLLGIRNILLLALAVVIGISWVKLKPNYFTGKPTDKLTPSVDIGRFSCTGKQHCSQMTSCEEATYYINHCPNTKMDGDRDGIPCEDQWCR